MLTLQIQYHLLLIFIFIFVLVRLSIKKASGEDFLDFFKKILRIHMLHAIE